MPESRVGYVGDDTTDPTVLRLFAEIRSVRGEVSNLFRAVAHCPDVLPAFFGLSRFVRDSSTLPARLRELAILATAFEFGVEYEIAAHKLAARQAGVTEAELAALARREWGALTGAELVAVRYAAEVARTRSASDETFRSVRKELSLPETIELVVTVAWYHLVTAVVQPLRVELEPQLRSQPPDHRKTADEPPRA